MTEEQPNELLEKKKILIFGAGGTVGKAFQEVAKHDFNLILWNRHEIPLDNFKAVEMAIERISPDFVYNFAVASSPTHKDENSHDINILFPGLLAGLSKKFDFQLIHTSTVMVFSDHNQGPFNLDSTPDADNGYGLDKLKAEEMILNEDGNSRIVRLGWQIENQIGSNNMTDYLESCSREGVINCSLQWIPSCSFVEDTAKALLDLREYEPSVYQLNSNFQYSFYEIVLRLKKLFNKPHWEVLPTKDFTYNQIMIDERVPIRKWDW